MNLDPIPAAVLGGTLVGLSAAGFLLLHGRVAGISGLIFGVVDARRGDVAWRLAFLAGMASVGLLARFALPEAVAFDLERPIAALVVAGLLVGFGTRLGGGCTSGHAICGVGSFSRRSLVATITFVAVGAVTVFASQYAFGGAQ